MDGSAAKSGALFRRDPSKGPKPTPSKPGQTKPNIVSKAAPSRRDQLPTRREGKIPSFSLAGSALPHRNRARGRKERGGGMDMEEEEVSAMRLLRVPDDAIRFFLPPLSAPPP